MDIPFEIAKLIDEIKNDNTHGASELARQAVDVMRQATLSSQAADTDHLRRELEEVGSRLMQARPVMAPIYNIVSRFLSGIPAAGGGLEQVRHFAISRADELIEASSRAVSQIAGHACGLISDGDVIITHSYSSTVVAALREAAGKYNIEVVVTRSGSGRTGERIVDELWHHGVPITFIDDAAVGLYVSRASKVMVGADRVCADGKVVNGIGTYQLALAAEKAGIPVYILCETLKFDPRLKAEAVDLEDKGPSEIVEAGRLPAGVGVKNPHFDITPPELVTGLVTENGLLTMEEAIAYLEKQSAEG